jgi:hypothetical protein
MTRKEFMMLDSALDYLSDRLDEMEKDGTTNTQEYLDLKEDWNRNMTFLIEAMNEEE